MEEKDKATESANLISDDEMVTSYKCGNYTEIVCCKHSISPIEVTRVSRGQYIDNITGEVKNYNFTSCKSIDNFKKDFKNIPRYIKGYFVGNDSEKFITLTYSFFMDNPYMLSYDFKKLLQKIERRYGKCRYFYIKEPHTNGSWHIHAIIKRLDNKPLILTKDNICSMWKQGNDIDVQPIYNVDTLPYYFDITRYEHKLSRLKYYPPHLRIYGHSTDMKILKKRGKYKSLKPHNSNKVYEKTDSQISVNKETGEIVFGYENVYQQFQKKSTKKGVLS